MEFLKEEEASRPLPLLFEGLSKSDFINKLLDTTIHRFCKILHYTAVFSQAIENIIPSQTDKCPSVLQLSGFLPHPTQLNTELGKPHFPMQNHNHNTNRISLFLSTKLDQIQYVILFQPKYKIHAISK